MANVISKTQVARYLEALKADEVEIAEAAEVFENAKARLDVGLRRYVALRDFVSEQMGRSPYEQGYEWPGDEGWGSDPSRGKFRFAGMKVGDAILEVLSERRAHPLTEWVNGETYQELSMSLDDLVEVLSNGGLGCPEPVGARNVNAALMALVKSESVTRDQQTGRYRYVEGDDESLAAAIVRGVQTARSERPIADAVRRPARKEIDPDDLPFE